MVTQMDIPSPCIGVCKIPEDDIYCSGCLRTRQEIKQWRQSENADKLIILERLKQRRKERGLIGQGERRPRRRKA